MSELNYNDYETLTMEDIFDLYVLNRDLVKSTGYGLFHPKLTNLLEKKIFVGKVSEEEFKQKYIKVIEDAKEETP